MTDLNKDLVETIADFFHMNWSHWMKYLYTKLEQYDSTGGFKDYDEDDFLMDRSDYDHWKRQMNTPYAELSEKEKDSDREWSVKLLELLNKTHEIRNKLNCTNCDEYVGEDHLCHRMI